MFVGFLIGMFVGSVLSGVALLLAIGITSQRDDEPSFIPFAIREGYRNADGSLTEKGKQFSDRRIVDKRGVERPDPTMPDRNIRGWL